METINILKQKTRLLLYSEVCFICWGNSEIPPEAYASHFRAHQALWTGEATCQKVFSSWQRSGNQITLTQNSSEQNSCGQPDGKNMFIAHSPVISFFATQISLSLRQNSEGRRLYLLKASDYHVFYFRAQKKFMFVGNGFPI